VISILEKIYQGNPLNITSWTLLQIRLSASFYCKISAPKAASDCGVEVLEEPQIESILIGLGR